MFLILKLIIIILLNESHTYVTQESEITQLPAWNTFTEVKEISLTFKAFGKLIQLKLMRNDQVAPLFKLWKKNSRNVTKKMLGLNVPDLCLLYFHKNHVNSAVINYCQEYGLEGFIFMKNNILEIWPLQNVHASLSFINSSCVKEQINQSFGQLHVITKSLKHIADLNLYHFHKIRTKHAASDDISPTWNKTYKELTFGSQENEKGGEEDKAEFAIQLAVFIDALTYRILMINLDNNIENIHNIIFRYVRDVEALFHHPSLGVLIDIVLVRLEIIKKFSSLSINTTTSFTLLDSFCQYAKNLDPQANNDPRHWDLALLITISQSQNLRLLRKKLYSAFYFDSVCNANFSCAAVTFNSEEVYNKEDIIAKMIEKLSYRTAQVIGRFLGLQHDDKPPWYKRFYTYVMHYDNVNRYNMINALTDITWSAKSRDAIQPLLKQKLCIRKRKLKAGVNYTEDNYDDNLLTFIHTFDKLLSPNNLPGRKQTAKTQCELKLQDENANVVTFDKICKNLECETPRIKESYFAGRALNGTYCAPGKECFDGKCVSMIKPPYNFNYCQKDEWSAWKKDSCTSNCLEKSKGVLVKRRYCKHRTHRTANCTGLYYDVILCNDSSVCTDKRISITEFTKIKCFEFRKLSKQANMTVELLIASGNQMPHNVSKPWIACTVFCRQKQNSPWYAPRQTMLDYNFNPYFPDGTWCHREGGQDYYCRKHHCVPENYSFKTEFSLLSTCANNNPEKNCKTRI